MHLLVRERAFLDAEGAAEDLGLAPAPVLFASHSDADLAMMAGAGVACAALARLAHPMSVDLLVERTLPGTGAVIVRLLGGIGAWSYGVDDLEAGCRRAGIPLALLAGDRGGDPQLRGRSTVSAAVWGRLDALMREGGRANWARARAVARGLSGAGGDTPGDGAEVAKLPSHGEFALGGEAVARPVGRAAIVLYRSHVLADDVAPVRALGAALAARGIEARALYVASPKSPADARFLAAELARIGPDVILNATCFSARDADGWSALEAQGVPVLQLVLAGSDEAGLRRDPRGLGPADLAMQVLLPELDGRLATAVVSAKIETDAGRRHAPLADGIGIAADRAAGWVRLARTPPAERRVAIVLSDYPGVAGASHATGHAVGLDGFASLARILSLLEGAGYRTQARDADWLVEAMCRRAPVEVMDATAYKAAFGTLPGTMREAIAAAHGAPDRPLSIAHHRLGRVVVAVQPQRGAACDPDRRGSYHDRDAAPSHDYAGFYLWLASPERVDAIVHLGTHGTLEWLPGKPDAATGACMPQALTGGAPVLYPFIVNNPGEATVAKRRLGAVAIGHLTPPLRAAGLDGEAAAIERLFDELAGADGVDPARASLLRREIVRRASGSGLLEEAGGSDAAGDALATLDAYLCDVKEMRIADGLHVFGTAPPDRDAMLAMVGDAQEEALDRSGADEAAALLACLDGRGLAPGPAGAPCPSRADVLPTGRNLVGSDSRLVPTATAFSRARVRADALLARHLQDEGEWPRTLMLDLWGSPCLRTGGEDLALAFRLVGASPIHDAATGRVEGVEIEPLATLGRPRVDVSLRISGLFRDLFATQIVLFDRAVRLVASRGFEAASDNPLAALGDTAPVRVFGPPPGEFGTGCEDWLARSAFGYGIGRDGTPVEEVLRALLARTDGFVHQQDLASTDVLDGPDHAAHEGGFARAAGAAGAVPAMYHARLDAGGGGIRTLADEIARVARGRLANPRWLAGMRRHGYRGASEMARGVEALLAFARTLPGRFDRQFELAYDAILHDDDNDAFLESDGPEARAAIVAAFEAARRERLWHPRRNSA